MLAKAAGVSLRSLQRIFEAHQLAPHRICTFKLAPDPKVAEKLKDVVGLYVDSPAHAVVHSVDEKSQFQALDLDRQTQREAVLWRPRLPRTTSEALHPDHAATLRSASSPPYGGCISRHTEDNVFSSGK